MRSLRRLFKQHYQSQAPRIHRHRAHRKVNYVWFIQGYADTVHNIHIYMDNWYVKYIIWIEPNLPQDKARAHTNDIWFVHSSYRFLRYDVYHKIWAWIWYHFWAVFGVQQLQAVNFKHSLFISYSSYHNML